MYAFHTSILHLEHEPFMKYYHTINHIYIYIYPTWTLDRMTYFWTSRCSSRRFLFWHHDVLCDAMAYLLALWHTFWHSEIFVCYGVLFMLGFTFWHPDSFYVLFVISRHVLYLYLWCTFWHKNILFKVIKYLLTLWRTYWFHSILSDVMVMKYFLYFFMCWRTFFTQRHRIWYHDILSIPFDTTCSTYYFNVLTYFVTLWHTFRHRMRFVNLFSVLYTLQTQSPVFTLFAILNKNVCSLLHYDGNTEIMMLAIYITLWSIPQYCSIFTSPPEGVARYCFHPVCLSVCVSVCVCVCVSGQYFGILYLGY